MNFVFAMERGEDGRWIAEAPGLPGVIAYGASRSEALARARALALEVIADRKNKASVEPDDL